MGEREWRNAAIKHTAHTTMQVQENSEEGENEYRETRVCVRERGVQERDLLCRGRCRREFQAWCWFLLSLVTCEECDHPEVRWTAVHSASISITDDGMYWCVCVCSSPVVVVVVVVVVLCVCMYGLSWQLWWLRSSFFLATCRQREFPFLRHKIRLPQKHTHQFMSTHTLIYTHTTSNTPETTHNRSVQCTRLQRASEVCGWRIVGKGKDLTGVTIESIESNPFLPLLQLTLPYCIHIWQTHTLPPIPPHQ